MPRRRKAQEQQKLTPEGVHVEEFAKFEIEEWKFRNPSEVVSWGLFTDVATKFQFMFGRFPLTYTTNKLEKFFFHILSPSSTLCSLRC